MKLSLAERLWSRVNKDNPPHPRLGTPCWTWSGARLPAGYGRMSARTIRGSAYTHRIAWTVTHGTIPEGKLVLHHCDNPPCCNPAHLFLGTHADNARDMTSKKRGLGGRAWSARRQMTQRQREASELMATKIVDGAVVPEHLAVTLLREVEWRDGWCLFCEEPEDDGETGGHDPDCRLAAILAGAAPNESAKSVPFVPTPEQATTSPLLTALAAKGATEREVIEHLFGSLQEWMRIAERLAHFRPVGPITIGGKTYTNPTADALAAEGHTRTLASILAESRANGAAAEREAIEGVVRRYIDGMKQESDAGSIKWEGGTQAARHILESVRDRGAPDERPLRERILDALEAILPAGSSVTATVMLPVTLDTIGMRISIATKAET